MGTLVSELSDSLPYTHHALDCMDRHRAVHCLLVIRTMDCRNVGTSLARTLMVSLGLHRTHMLHVV